jgi:hypothetical protein
MSGILARAGVALLVASLGVGCQPAAQDSSSGQATPTEVPESDHFTVLPDKVTWLHPPPDAAFLPEGVQLALLEGGSPLDKGPFTFRLRFPPGSRLMPHTHPTIDRITVISGLLHAGMGKRFDPALTEAVPAGGFVYQAADVPHYVWFDQETVLQFSGNGPFGLTYVNPSDDPRNQK